MQPKVGITQPLEDIVAILRPNFASYRFQTCNGGLYATQSGNHATSRGYSCCIFFGNDLYFTYFQVDERSAVPEDPARDPGSQVAPALSHQFTE